jgi:trimeric autotransporter adhesin
MAQEIADLFVILRSVTDPFSKGLKSAAADAESQSKRMSSALGAVTKIGLGASAAVIGIGVASIKAASSFQSEMTKLVTQAGVSKAQLGLLSDGVLKLAGQVGFSPTSLAESLYHVESNFESMGITSTHALGLVKIAAEGAALTAAVASGIPGVQNMSDAMGALNKIVGVGDMSMQDLADAFGTGMLATVKGFGVTLADVGAGLATFGDNNIRGAVAGTDFRMAIQALAKPAATAGDTLSKLGLTTDTLAQDMQKGGLKLALTDLVDRMNKAGVTASQ